MRKAIREGWLTIGKHTYGMPAIHSYRGSERKVVIGDYCSIGPGTKFITGGIHPSEWVSLYPFRVRWQLPGAYDDGMPSSRGDIIVGSDVWIGTDVTILSGVEIGHGAVVATGAVVTESIPPYAIAGGVPARVIKYRFPEATIERLLKIQWWNWPEEEIRKAVPLLSSDKINAFLDACNEEE
jgi:acetyltransferase-like isoleucine patch superfamily enzyme